MNALGRSLICLTKPANGRRIECSVADRAAGSHVHQSVPANSMGATAHRVIVPHTFSKDVGRGVAHESSHPREGSEGDVRTVRPAAYMVVQALVEQAAACPEIPSRTVCRIQISERDRGDWMTHYEKLEKAWAFCPECNQPIDLTKPYGKIRCHKRWSFFGRRKSWCRGGGRIGRTPEWAIKIGEVG